MTEIAVRVVAAGQVQGIGYRAWTVREARGRGLRGWVRNRGDGSVEALLIGAPAAVEDMIEAMRRGPAMAHVTDLAREAAPDDGTAGFSTHPTV
jgi:acylphosphatase